MGAFSIRELLYIFSSEGCADLHFSSQEGTKYTNSKTILYSDVLFIVLLDTIVRYEVLMMKLIIIKAMATYPTKII